MSAATTPGPWFAHALRTHGADRSKDGVDIEGADGSCVAIVLHHGPDERTRGETIANGRLVVAAPALRDALKHLAAVIDAAGVFNLSRGVELGPVVWSVKCTDAMRDAHAALAAAGVIL